MTRRALRTQAEIVTGKRYSLGYGAVEDTTRRRSTVRSSSGEAFILNTQRRERASATARDDRRNFTILAWMIRRHLDCVSRFTPHFRTGDKKIDELVKKIINWHAMRRNFDALQRHSRDESMRMFEACKVISGDAGLLKVQGLRLQGIEGDRITKPTAFPEDTPQAMRRRVNKINDCGIEFVKGVRKSFCVCSREADKQASMFEALIPAEDIIFDGYWPERFDADRGVSPLLTALNEGADVRDTWEWLVLKAKASALFGLAFTRTSSDEMYPSMGETPTDAPETEGAAYSQQVTDAIKARGIMNLDLDPGDMVNEIESKTPNPQIIEFTRELIRSVLLALDIPFTFYDSLTASFSARIADRNEYEESCEWKRDKNVSILDEIYGGWLFPKWIEADLFGLGAAVRAAKIDTETLAASLRWVPAGRPWLDRRGEMSGHILALQAGATSIPRICAQYGEDAYVIAEEQKAYLETAGIPLLYGAGGQQAVQSIMADAMKPTDENGNPINDNTGKEAGNSWLM